MQFFVPVLSSPNYLSLLHFLPLLSLYFISFLLSLSSFLLPSLPVPFLDLSSLCSRYFQKQVSSFSFTSYKLSLAPPLLSSSCSLLSPYSSSISTSPISNLVFPHLFYPSSFIPALFCSDLTPLLPSSFAFIFLSAHTSFLHSLPSSFPSLFTVLLSTNFLQFYSSVLLVSTPLFSSFCFSILLFCSPTSRFFTSLPLSISFLHLFLSFSFLRSFPLHLSYINFFLLPLFLSSSLPSHFLCFLVLLYYSRLQLLYISISDSQQIATFNLAI